MKTLKSFTHDPRAGKVKVGTRGRPMYREAVEAPVPSKRKAEIKFTSTELAWLAGYLEGEACFSPRRERISAPKISVTSVDKDVIERVVDLMGSSGPWLYKAKTHRHKDAYATEISGPEAISIMEQILPFMGARRAERIREILKEDAEFVPNNLRYRKTCKYGHHFDTVYWYNGKRLRKCSLCANRLAREAYARNRRIS